VVAKDVVEDWECGCLPGLKGIGCSGKVFKILFSLFVRNEWMSVNDFHELGLKVLVFGWKIVFGRAILSRNECKVQCVAQTCLEKGRAEEQVYGECKGEKRRKETKRVEDILFVLQQGRLQEKEHVSQSCCPAEGRGCRCSKCGTSRW
jgi:hypothetical protein